MVVKSSADVQKSRNLFEFYRNIRRQESNIIRILYLYLHVCERVRNLRSLSQTKIVYLVFTSASIISFHDEMIIVTRNYLSAKRTLTSFGLCRERETLLGGMQQNCHRRMYSD